jgi:hypothetical protein
MTRQIQWKTLVNAADKDRNKPVPVYEFTGSKDKVRTFYHPVNYNPYTGSSGS